MTQPISQAHFQELLNAEDGLLILVIKAHFSIDSLLNETLKLRMPEAGAVELGRVSFVLKVDFLVALGVLRKPLRPLFDKINSIRNRFAHNPYASFDEADAKKVKQILLSQKPALVPPNFVGCDNDLEILQMLFGVCFMNLRAARTAIARRQIENEVSELMAQETVRKVKAGIDVDFSRAGVDGEFRSRSDALLRSRFPDIDT